MRFIPVPWSDAAARELTRCYDRDGWKYLVSNVLEKDVKSGDATLYEARSPNGNVYGYVVAHVEIADGKKEFVIAAAAMNATQSVKSYLPAYEDLARSIGCEKFRLHSTKKGMWRMFETCGFDNVERVYCKELI